MALVICRIAVEDSELRCYNTDGGINSVVSQASCRMGWTLLELQAETDIKNRASITF